jgi:hypothetical protein
VALGALETGALIAAFPILGAGPLRWVHDDRLGIANVRRAFDRLDAATAGDEPLFRWTYGVMLGRHVALLKSVRRLVGAVMPPLGRGEPGTASPSRRALQRGWLDASTRIPSAAARAPVERGDDTLCVAWLRSALLAVPADASLGTFEAPRPRPPDASAAGCRLRSRRTFARVDAPWPRRTGGRGGSAPHDR